MQNACQPVSLRGTLNEDEWKEKCGCQPQCSYASKMQGRDDVVDNTSATSGMQAVRVPKKGMKAGKGWYGYYLK